MDMPVGCAFHPRCPEVMDICRRETPELLEPKPQHLVRCWLYQKEKTRGVT
jgi:oligopeptide/dipeptide ABC transporter ATP-binding protein